MTGNGSGEPHASAPGGAAGAPRQHGPADKAAPWIAWGKSDDGLSEEDFAEPKGRFALRGRRTPMPQFSEPSEPPPGPPPNRKARIALIAVAALVGLFVLYTAVGLVTGDDDPVDSAKNVPSTPVLEPTTPPDAAQPRELEPATAEDQLGSGHVALKVTDRQLLRTRPHPEGRLVARVGRKTPYGGQVILPILKARGDWVAVVSPYRKNNKVAWTKVDEDAKFVAVEYSIAIRVSDRSIIVRKNGKVIKRMKAAVGQVTHPTPPGRYAVTDGLIFKQKVRGPYGCCALVLSARQTKLPSGWTGGDRIAIHGTPNKQSIGLAASLGCLRVGDEASRWLVRKIPPGTTVFVRP